MSIHRRGSVSAEVGQGGTVPSLAPPFFSPRARYALCPLCGLILSCAVGNVHKTTAGVVEAPSMVIVPSGPAAVRYTTRVAAGLPGDVLVEQIAVEIQRGRPKGGQALLRDGRLDRVARDIARVTGARRPPPPEAVAFLLWHYGVVEPEPNLFLLRGDSGAESSALATLSTQLATAPAASAWRRLGIGVERGGGQWSAVVLLQEKHLDVEPVPRALRSGNQTTIAGRVQPAFRSPEVLVTPPLGAVERPVTRVRGNAFSARIVCNLGDGAYQVEIAGEDERGPRVLANFPIYCGLTPPASFRVEAATAPAVTDPVQLERQLLDLLDGDRRAAGLPPLVRDPRLAAVARRYSREMAETGEVAHVSPRTGNVIDRVRGAGITPAPTILAENVGSAASAADAERAFMGSPGHRDNILHRDVTHVGVGVAVGKGQGGMVSLFFTQVFASWAK
jgi:uncharacterized protein YkwD